MRTPSEMASDLNCLNGNSVDGRYNPVTKPQMELVYQEARQPLLEVLEKAEKALESLVYFNRSDTEALTAIKAVKAQP